MHIIGLIAFASLFLVLLNGINAVDFKGRYRGPPRPARHPKPAGPPTKAWQEAVIFVVWGGFLAAVFAILAGFVFLFGFFF